MLLFKCKLWKCYSTTTHLTYYLPYIAVHVSLEALRLGLWYVMHILKNISNLTQPQIVLVVYIKCNSSHFLLSMLEMIFFGISCNFDCINTFLTCIFYETKLIIPSILSTLKDMEWKDFYRDCCWIGGDFW
jgi:hypothetical protein